MLEQYGAHHSGHGGIFMPSAGHPSHHHAPMHARTMLTDQQAAALNQRARPEGFAYMRASEGLQPGMLAPQAPQQQPGAAAAAGSMQRPRRAAAQAAKRSFGEDFEYMDD